MLRQGSIVFAVLFALVLSVLPFQAGSAAAASSMYVTSGQLNVRTAPSLSASVATRVYAGDAVVVTGSVEGQAVNGDSTWYITKSGYYVSAAYLSGATPAAITAASGGKWIDVNLSTLRIRAMVGNQAVYSAPITTGKAGWRTPTGTFTINRRTLSTNMDSTTIGLPQGATGAYYQPNVPYVQYFDNAGDAIHGNYWSPRDSFGNYNTSHGCVGLTPGAAAWFYNFGYSGMKVSIHY